MSTESVQDPRTHKPTANIPAPPVSPAQTQRALQILALLATTLDINRLIEIFAKEVNEAVAHDGAAYENEADGLAVELGAAERHSCSYRLAVEDNFLGQIRFTRKRKFTDSETAIIENLLVSLVYPLRNALQYKRALDEARRDPLTGAYNRGVMESVLERDVGLARRNQTPYSVIFMDIDRFKAINDTHGHAVGDQAIRTLVACVNQSIRTTDMLARYGGDEFVVLLNNTPIEGAKLLAERIRVAIEQADCRDASAARVSLSSSIGVASLAAADTPASLLERADSALNAAKLAGRNRVHG